MFRQKEILVIKVDMIGNSMIGNSTIKVDMIQAIEETCRGFSKPRRVCILPHLDSTLPHHTPALYCLLRKGRKFESKLETQIMRRHYVERYG
jgi:hypothetical protein